MSSLVRTRHHTYARSPGSVVSAAASTVIAIHVVSCPVNGVLEAAWSTAGPRPGGEEFVIEYVRIYVARE
jgi:hypothetical protein